MSVPKEWLDVPHYEILLGWYSRDPSKPRNFDRIFKDMLPDHEDRESKIHPGWYFYTRAGGFDVARTLEQAKKLVQQKIMDWNMVNPITRDVVEVNPSIPERRAIAQQVRDFRVSNPHPLYDPDSHEEQPELVKLHWIFDQYLLDLVILYSPYAERFTTQMGKPNNPILSLVGKGCTLSSVSYDDAEEEDEPKWSEVAVGPLSMGPVSFDGQRLSIGFWSHVFPSSLEVEGVAYIEAQFSDDEQELHYDLRSGTGKY